MLRVNPNEFRKLATQNYFTFEKIVLEVVRELVSHTGGRLINLRPSRIYRMVVGRRYPDPLVLYQIRYVVMQYFADCWLSEYARVKGHVRYGRRVVYQLYGYVFDLSCVKCKLQELKV